MHASMHIHEGSRYNIIQLIAFKRIILINRLLNGTSLEQFANNGTLSIYYVNVNERNLINRWMNVCSTFIAEWNVE